MRKITALVAHLKQVTGLPREHIHAYADKGVLAPTGRHLGESASGEQVEAGVWKYDAVIQIERYAGDGPTLMAVILGWLADNDSDRDGLADPEVDVDLNDPKTCDVEIACEFEERITIIEDAAGPIRFNGKRWRIADAEIFVVESVTGLEGGRGY